MFKIELNKRKYDDMVKQFMSTIVELSRAKGVVERALGRDIVWIDKDKMNETDRLAWGNEAQALLDNRVFQSLVGQVDREGNKTNGEIVKNIIEGIARNSKDYDEVQFLRATINGIELIREYAEELLIKKDKETFDDLNAGI